MSFSRKKPIEETPVEETAVWLCSTSGCNGWMRDGFSFDDEPTCLQCRAPMIKSVKMLPVLMNSTVRI